jgi:hypothetical protein
VNLGLAAVPGARPVQECKDTTCLPSSNSAYALVAGVPGALPGVVLHFLGRSAIIGTGLWVGGFRPKEAVRGALAAAVLFEASLLLWSAQEVSKHGTDV